jgi:hypothetical protein
MLKMHHFWEEKGPIVRVREASKEMPPKNQDKRPNLERTAQPKVVALGVGPEARAVSITDE